MNISEELDRVAEEAWEAQAQKQSELVNLTFTLVAARLITYEYQGEQRQTYIATVTMDGVDSDYYLGGSIIDRQVKWLLDEKKLPCRVRLIRDADRKGSPYVLKSTSENSTQSEATVKTTDDAHLIIAAIEARGIDEVALALGDYADLIVVGENGEYELPTKGLKMTDAFKIRSKLQELIPS